MRSNVAKLLVECLENEGVKYIFGIPGEENIHFIDALPYASYWFVMSKQRLSWLTCTVA
jgi:acetolactate synthase-1/2/3 large subunit